MIDPHQEFSAEELASQAVAELPVREAMSLISTDPSTSFLSGYADAGDGLGLTGTTTGGSGAADPAAGMAGSAMDVANDASTADSSGAEGGDVSETDRTERYSQSDSASAVS